MNEHTLKDAFSEVTAKTSFDMEKSVKKKKAATSRTNWSLNIGIENSLTCLTMNRLI